MDQQLEITLTKLKTRYKASCKLFPECKGVGETEEKALLKLSQSIAKAIAKYTEDNLKKLLLSDSYTEVLIDSTLPQKTQQRVFKISANFKPNRSFLLKYKAPDISPYFNNEELQAEDIQKVLEQMDEILLAHGHSVQVVEGLGGMIDRPNEDGIAFGFPLSLN